MIEVMVAIIITTFGLLGFAGMQARATAAEFESYQRSQALTLVEDLVSRMNANRTNAASYVTTGLIGAGPVQDCSGLLGAALDLCQWGNLIRGSTEDRGGAKVGSMIGARGCVTRPSTSSDRYIVAIAWQGIVPTGAPGSPCGQGDASFPKEALRRAVSSTMCVALLRDPTVSPPLPRC